MLKRKIAACDIKKKVWNFFVHLIIENLKIQLHFYLIVIIGLTIGLGFRKTVLIRRNILISFVKLFL